jgi:hypothetical protein
MKDEDIIQVIVCYVKGNGEAIPATGRGGP